MTSGHNAWAASQYERSPDTDWEATAAFVRDDRLWEGVPRRIRQNEMVQFAQMQQAIAGGPDTETLGQTAAYIASQQLRYPHAAAWSEWRTTIGRQLQHMGYDGPAADFGVSA